MNKLINKISMQVEGLLRGNLSKIIGDLDQLCKENSSGEIPVTVKISISKGQFYIYGSQISWNKAVKHSDETEMETYDQNQPDLFQDDGPEEKEFAKETKLERMGLTITEKPKKGKRQKDTMQAERTLTQEQAPCDKVVNGDEFGCCSCEESCDLKMGDFGKASACVSNVACSKECPRFEKFTESAIGK